MSTYIERIMIEKDDLDAKIRKLDAFLMGDPILDMLDKQSKTLLHAQMSAMQAYSFLLSARLNHDES